MKRLVLLDANLLILLVAGKTDRRIIQSHKRLQTFRDVDYDLVCDFIARHGDLALLPNVATEASNFLAHMRDPYRTALRQTMKAIVEAQPELTVSSQAAVNRPEFLRLGLTDAAVLAALDGATSLLTADLDLFLAALACGLTAWNFEHLRDQTI